MGSVGCEEMKTIVIVGCTSKKKSYPCVASEMYSESVLFVKTIKYVESYYSEGYLILSAKYGILKPTDIIEPYNFSMKDATRCSREYANVIASIKSELAGYDKIIALCGRDYIKMIRIALPETCIVEPLKGMGIGTRLHFLKERCC
jgi:hypothetical protein